MRWIFLSLLVHSLVVFGNPPSTQPVISKTVATYISDAKFLRGIIPSGKTYAPLITLAEITQRHPNWWVWFPETLKALQKKAEKSCVSADTRGLSAKDIANVRTLFTQHHPKTLNGWGLYKKIQKKSIWDRAFLAYTHHCGFAGVKELYPLIKKGSLDARPLIHALLLKGDQQSVSQARELLTFVTTVCKKSDPRYTLLAQLVAKNTNGETSAAYGHHMASCKKDSPWKKTLTLAALGHYIRSDQGEKALQARQNLKQEAHAHPKEMGSLDVNIMGQLMQEGQKAEVEEKSGLAKSLYTKALSIPIIPGEHAHEAYWRKGFIYATGLKQYTKALECFTHASSAFSASVLDPKHIIKLKTPLKTPPVGITRHDVRALFWAGFAAQHLKKGALAKVYFTQASRYGTYLYGQMACWKLGKPIVLNFANPSPGPQNRQAVGQREVLRIIKIWKTTAPNQATLPAYDTTLALCKDIMALAQSSGDNAMALKLIKILYPDHGVESAASMAKHSNSVFRAKYPIIPVAVKDSALVHSIIAQESCFKTNALSWVGAIGMMQIMEGTAKTAAKEMGIPLDMVRLRKDPAYQITMGSHIIRDYVKKLDGRYIPGIAAYNAGVHRAKPWVANTPKWSQPEDALMWIESIPFKETHHYVLRVLEGYIVYRILMNKPLDRTEWTHLLRVHG